MGEISWVFSMNIKEGQRQAVETLFAEMSAHTKETEPGALVYELTISEDGTSGQVNETYRDSEAGMDHMKSFGKSFAARLMALVEPTGMHVFGEPDDALMAALDTAGAVYMKPVGGFRR